MSVKYQKLSVLENRRNKFIVSGNFDDFKKTYFAGKSEKIANLNTAGFWEKKHKVDFKSLSSSPIYKDKVNIIFKWLRGKKGKLLDIGFGSGEIERELQKSTLDLYGIEISREIVQSMHKYRGNYKFGSIYNIPFGNNSFDFLLALDIFEHLESKKTFSAYKEVNRVLKRRGLLIISVPLNENLDEMLEEGFNPNGHMRIYSPLILKGELTIAGFEISKEVELYAFEKYYLLKKMIKYLFPMFFKKPNLIIIFAQKK